MVIKYATVDTNDGVFESKSNDLDDACKELIQFLEGYGIYMPTILGVIYG
jgi:hypothetical protein